MEYKKQLSSILQASGWSQEELARQLEVSFAALNAWLRSRAVPRKSSQLRIEQLYFDVVGAPSVAPDSLAAAKTVAQTHKLTAAKIVRDKKLLDKLTLYLTYHTNTIEGSTMTLADVGDVIFDHRVLANRTLVEQAEARNHQAALNWLLDELATQKELRITEDFIRGIHLRLMNGIMSDAGTYRRHSVRIMGSRTAVANWLKVPDLMQAFVTSGNRLSEDVIDRLARMHADFEKIHPFSDGNGRTGRLLLLTMALQTGLVPPIVLKERKHAYYKYLEMAQIRGEYTALTLFIAESVVSASRLLDL